MDPLYRRPSITQLLKYYVHAHTQQRNALVVTTTTIEVHVPLWVAERFGVKAHPGTFARKWRQLIANHGLAPLAVTPFVKGKVRAWEITAKSQ